MPFLILAKALEQSCPGLPITPIDPNDATPLSAANGSSLQLVGSIDLHFQFSGPSVVSVQDGKEATQGPAMQYWYSACAAVSQNLSTPYIKSAPLLCTHMMQISYNDRLGPTVTLEKGKSFPFYHQSQVKNANGCTLYPKWQLHGKFKPFNSPNCPDVLLQEGGQEPRLREPQLAQRGKLGQGGLGQQQRGGAGRGASN